MILRKISSANVRLVCGLGMVLILAGCHKAPATPEGGRCFENKDCKSGSRCVEGWCEDIYHPKQDIKQGV